MQEFRYEKFDRTSYQMGLDNGFKVIVAPTKSDKVTLGINVGKGTYLVDGSKIGNQLIYRGTASFLQYCLINKHAKEAEPLFGEGIKNVSKTFESYTTFAFETTSDKYLSLIEPLISLVNDFKLENDGVEALKKGYLELALSEGKKEYQLQRKALFVNSPLKDNLYGDEQSVKHIHLNSLKKFFNEFYSLDNLTLVVCGNVNQADIEALVRAYNFNGPIAKREELTAPIMSENYAKLNEMRVIKNEDPNSVRLAVKFEKREPLYNEFGGYIFSLYYLMGDIFFSEQNSKFVSICKNFAGINDIKVYEASEETYLSVDFKVQDKGAFLVELEKYLSLGKKMVSYRDFISL